MVADNVIKNSFFNISVNMIKMDKTFIAFS